MHSPQPALAATLCALVIAGSTALAAGTGQQPAAAQPPAAVPPAAVRPPAASLVRPTSPVKATDAAGFIQRWLVFDPIPVSNQLTETAVQAAVKQHAIASSGAIPRDAETAAVGTETLAWHAVDTLGYNVNLFHFAYARNKPTSNVLFWAVTVVQAPRDLPGVRLAIGSNAASVWWLDGEEVISLYNDRQAVIDDGVSKRLTLKRGPNVIRAAVVNAGGATDFCARFIDEDGNPVKGLTITLAAEGLQR
jgi:hypothetical protein